MGNTQTVSGQFSSKGEGADRTAEGASRLNRSSALVDILVVLAVLVSVWSLRFAGVSQVGPLTMAAGLLTVGLMMTGRRQSFRSLGLAMPGGFSEIWSPALRLLGLFGLVWLSVGFLVTAVIGQPETSTAITSQPESWWGFLLDITLVTWVLIAFGEEVVFRGFMLQRLLLIIGESPLARYTAIGLQAALFGLGHASQGIAGVLLTAAIGYLFGWFFLTHAKRCLWPLILVHGVADTAMLTVSFLYK